MAMSSSAGCCPRNDQSNFKIKSTRISRAGSYLKPVLVQDANALIRSKSHPEITERYRRIKSHRGHKKAIIAICRMTLTAIWHILTDLKPYTAEGYLAPRPVKKEKILTTSQALNLLKLRGYVIKDDFPVTASWLGRLYIFFERPLEGLFAMPSLRYLTACLFFQTSSPFKADYNGIPLIGQLVTIQAKADSLYHITAMAWTLL